MKTITLLASSLLLCSPASLCAKDLEGAWVMHGLQWSLIEGDTESRVRVADAQVLYFKKGGELIIVNCKLLRRSKEYVTISRGDGETVYKGDWATRKGEISITYRLVEVAIPTTGQSLPGPLQSGIIKLAENQLLTFEGKRFRRAVALDQYFK